MFCTCASASLHFFFGKWVTHLPTSQPPAVRFRPSGVLALAFLVALTTLAVAAYATLAATVSGAVSDHERTKWGDNGSISIGI